MEKIFHLFNLQEAKDEEYLLVANAHVNPNISTKGRLKT